MSTRLPGPTRETAPPSPPAARIAAGVIGVLAMAVGVALLFHPTAAASVLAILIGLGLLLAGAAEIAGEWDSGHRGTSLVLGGLLVLGGILAVAWPQVTLTTLAFIVGLVLIAHGVLRIVVAIALREGATGWGWLAFAGGVNVVFGVAALIWPQVTVLVLSLLLGVQIVLFAALMLMLAFWPRRTETGAW